MTPWSWKRLHQTKLKSGALNKDDMTCAATYYILLVGSEHLGASFSMGLDIDPRSLYRELCNPVSGNKAVHLHEASSHRQLDPA